MRLALCIMGMVVALSASADEISLTDEISLEAMEEARGGQLVEIELDLISATSDIDGFVAGNEALNTVTGNNYLTSGAFTDSSGISSVIQNTGNNVLIQNATVVNVTLK